MFTLQDNDLSAVVNAAIITQAISGSYNTRWGDSEPKYWDLPTEVRNVKYIPSCGVTFTVVKANGLVIHTSLSREVVRKLDDGDHL